MFFIPGVGFDRNIALHRVLNLTVLPHDRLEGPLWDFDKLKDITPIYGSWEHILDTNIKIVSPDLVYFCNIACFSYLAWVLIEI